MIVGQERVIEMIDEWALCDCAPRFIIFVGEKGSGRTVMTNYLASKLHAMLAFPENSVAEVRATIESAYKCSSPVVYVFKEAEGMSTAAKNALLKITEEPPKQAYIVLTISSETGILKTLLSRAPVVKMQEYTEHQVSLFNSTGNVFVSKVCTTPGEVMRFNHMNVDQIDEFYAFCEQIVNSVHIVTGVNAIKIATRVAFKDETDKYDPVLLVKAVRFLYTHKILSRKIDDYVMLNNYFRAITICSKYIDLLSRVGLKRDSTFDMWILDLRDVFLE